MTANAERELIKSAYPTSLRWKDRVNKMTDAQVIAVYMRLKRDGKLKL